jgi:hypothetical protein
MDKFAFISTAQIVFFNWPITESGGPCSIFLVLASEVSFPSGAGSIQSGEAGYPANSFVLQKEHPEIT